MEFPEKAKVQSCVIKFRPRYNETDQGGVVHHSIYPIYFEMGRTELLRENGIAYKDLEAAGVFFVVARLDVKYRQPARYDEELELETVCTTVKASKVEHRYTLKRCSDGLILSEGSSVLCCVNKEGKIRHIPEFMYPAI
ncbi:MAG: acyl-CoA thioesterase [Sedimentisphaerales bacterium]|nr:acyl-CoA thioesterase [Sedimentisphaerales bacterium]